MRERQIVCSTLSACGSYVMTSLSHTFDTVVVDEASQVREEGTQGHFESKTNKKERKHGCVVSVFTLAMPSGK